RGRRREVRQKGVAERPVREDGIGRVQYAFVRAEEGVGERRVQAHVLAAVAGGPEAAIANTEAQVEQQVSEADGEEQEAEAGPPARRRQPTRPSVRPPPLDGSRRARPNAPR